LTCVLAIAIGLTISLMTPNVYSAHALIAVSPDPDHHGDGFPMDATDLEEYMRSVCGEIDSAARQAGLPQPKYKACWIGYPPAPSYHPTFWQRLFRGIDSTATQAGLPAPNLEKHLPKGNGGNE
jgi:hypothetical protein